MHMDLSLEGCAKMFLKRIFTIPASENTVGILCAVETVAMALLLWAIIYQSDVIAYQRDLIRALWSWKFGN
jgi:hypothetical protein